jgi:inorganic pyrophosphatase
MPYEAPFYRWRPHPWHGLKPGEKAPQIVNAYIELTPFDLVKFEIDKVTGYLRADRPQRSSSQPPTLYGFVPQTYCGPRVCELSPKAKRGDGDPIDICVLSERPINRAEVILPARVVGGLQAIDNDEADDKIIAILTTDSIWGDISEVSELPKALISRMMHYFSTYKMVSDERRFPVTIEQVYGAEYAQRVVAAAIEDYDEEFGR